MITSKILLLVIIFLPSLLYLMSLIQTDIRYKWLQMFFVVVVKIQIQSNANTIFIQHNAANTWPNALLASSVASLRCRVPAEEYPSYSSFHFHHHLKSKLLSPVPVLLIVIVIMWDACWRMELSALLFVSKNRLFKSQLVNLSSSPASSASSASLWWLQCSPCTATVSEATKRKTAICLYDLIFPKLSLALKLEEMSRLQKFSSCEMNQEVWRRGCAPPYKKRQDTTVWYIDHVVVIGSEFCNTGVGLSENLKKWGAEMLWRIVLVA